MGWLLKLKRRFEERQKRYFYVRILIEEREVVFGKYPNYDWYVTELDGETKLKLSNKTISELNLIRDKYYKGLPTDQDIDNLTEKLRRIT